MKIILILFLSIFTRGTHAQTTINTNGTSATMSAYQGAFGADIFLKMPKRALNNPFKLVDTVGRLQAGPDSLPYYHDGRQFRQILLKNKADLLYQQKGDYATNANLSGYMLKPTGTSGQVLNGQGIPITLPAGFSGNYDDLTNKPALFSGAYADLTGKPALFSGSYLDLTNKPSLFSGAYVDLTGKPILFSGNYTDLSGKPTLFSGSYVDLTNKPSTFPPAAHTHAFTDVPGLQAALDSKLTSEVDGSITNEIELPAQAGQTGKVLGTNGSAPVWQTAASGTVTSVALGSSSLAVSGTPVTGAGTLSVNLNTTGVTAGSFGVVTVDTYGRVTAGKRQQTYSGVTDASGTYTVIFSTPYPAAPNIQCQVIGGSTETFLRVVGVTTSGFTINVFTRGVVTSLPIVGALAAGLLGSAATPLSSAAVDVLVTEK